MDKEAELKRIAIETWDRLEDFALECFRPDLVRKHRPQPGADWRQIDAATAALRNELLKVQA